MDTSLQQSDLEKRQIADQPRLTWNWSIGKSREPYEPQVLHKWWSPGIMWVDPSLATNTAHSLVCRGHKGNVDKWAPRYRHIARIMETELGEQVHGDNRCTRCVRRGYECWRYSATGGDQIDHPGFKCARCRAAGRNTECSSESTRRPPREWQWHLRTLSVPSAASTTLPPGQDSRYGSALPGDDRGHPEATATGYVNSTAWNGFPSSNQTPPSSGHDNLASESPIGLFAMHLRSTPPASDAPTLASTPQASHPIPNSETFPSSSVKDRSSISRILN